MNPALKVNRVNYGSPSRGRLDFAASGLFSFTPLMSEMTTIGYSGPICDTMVRKDSIIEVYGSIHVDDDVIRSFLLVNTLLIPNVGNSSESIEPVKHWRHDANSLGAHGAFLRSSCAVGHESGLDAAKYSDSSTVEVPLSRTCERFYSVFCFLFPISFRVKSERGVFKMIAGAQNARQNQGGGDSVPAREERVSACVVVLL